MPSTVQTIAVRTQRRSHMVEITDEVQRRCTDIASGFAIVYVPHTTAGVTIQENADPDVQHDLLKKLDMLVPKHEPFYRHSEGNSDSHLKTAMIGNSAMVLIDAGKLILGQWQGIYLCEFDGPRSRQVMVRYVSTPA